MLRLLLTNWSAGCTDFTSSVQYTKSACWQKGPWNKLTPGCQGHPGPKGFKAPCVKFGFGLVAHLLGYLNYFACIIYPHAARGSLEGTYSWAAGKSSGVRLLSATLAVS